MTEWRSVHIGTADDELRIHGIEVWKHEWRSTKETSLRLPHPSYPSQTHAFDVYEIDGLLHPIRFAAGELTNGVWGFYIPS